MGDGAEGAGVSGVAEGWSVVNHHFLPSRRLRPKAGWRGSATGGEVKPGCPSKLFPLPCIIFLHPQCFQGKIGGALKSKGRVVFSELTGRSRPAIGWVERVAEGEGKARGETE